jgi:hypothetical protein
MVVASISQMETLGGGGGADASITGQGKLQELSQVCLLLQPGQ